MAAKPNKNAEQAQLNSDRRYYLETILFQVKAVAIALEDAIGDAPEQEHASLLALAIKTIAHGALVEVEAL